MRNSIITLLVLISITTSAQQEKVRIIYEMKGQTDSLNPNSRFTELMYLDIYKEYSVFKSRQKYLNDSVMNEPNFQQQIILSGSIDMRQFANVKVGFIVQKNKLSQEITFQNSFSNNHLEYTLPYDSLQWVLTTDTSTINGIHCKKAAIKLGGRNYFAYYTPDVPINDGPYKFCNLPGLITYVYDEKNYYSFKLISIEILPSDPVNIKNISYTKVSRSQYFDYQLKVKENPELLFQKPTDGNIVSSNGESIEQLIQIRVKQIKEQNKKNNNPLEF